MVIYIIRRYNGIPVSRNRKQPRWYIPVDDQQQTVGASDPLNPSDCNWIRTPTEIAAHA
jgi:hypothetical protein